LFEGFSDRKKILMTVHMERPMDCALIKNIKKESLPGTNIHIRIAIAVLKITTNKNSFTNCSMEWL